MKQPVRFGLAEGTKNLRSSQQNTNFSSENNADQYYGNGKPRPVTPSLRNGTHPPSQLRARNLSSANSSRAPTRIIPSQKSPTASRNPYRTISSSKSSRKNVFFSDDWGEMRCAEESSMDDNTINYLSCSSDSDDEAVSQVQRINSADASVTRKEHLQMMSTSRTESVTHEPSESTESHSVTPTNGHVTNTPTPRTASTASTKLISIDSRPVSSSTSSRPVTAHAGKRFSRKTEPAAETGISTPRRGHFAEMRQGGQRKRISNGRGKLRSSLQDEVVDNCNSSNSSGSNSNLSNTGRTNKTHSPRSVKAGSRQNTSPLSSPTSSPVPPIATRSPRLSDGRYRKHKHGKVNGSTHNQSTDDNNKENDESLENNHYNVNPAWSMFESHVKLIDDCTGRLAAAPRRTFVASPVFQNVMTDLYGRSEYNKTRSFLRLRCQVGNVATAASKFLGRVKALREASEEANEEAEDDDDGDYDEDDYDRWDEADGGDIQNGGNKDTPGRSPRSGRRRRRVSQQVVETARRAWKILRNHVMEEAAKKRMSRTALSWDLVRHTLRRGTNQERARLDIYQRYGLMPMVMPDGSVVQENTMLSERAREAMRNKQQQQSSTCTTPEVSSSPRPSLIRRPGRVSTATCRGRSGQRHLPDMTIQGFTGFSRSDTM